jgi:hypothetical protein
MGGVPADSPADGRPFLLFRDPEDRQQVFFFGPGSTSASVGRLPASDLALEWDAQVSRRHARFEYVEEAWVLVDDGVSSNGTFVNDERLAGTHRLNDGDILRFGTTTVTFRLPERARAVPVDLSTTQRRVLTALCRPYKGRSGHARPATDQQIADELFLAVGVVKTHLSVLYAKLGVGELPRDEARARLAERALGDGLICERDL